MKRIILAFLAGFVAWMVTASLLDRGLRMMLAGYAAAEPRMTFTLGMMIARLAVGAISSLLGGAVTGWVAPSGRHVGWVLGAVLLAVFIPEHVKLWNVFPIWYHLTFLTTLVPLFALSSWLARSRPTSLRESNSSPPGAPITG